MTTNDNQKLFYTSIVFTKPLLKNNEFYSSIASSHLLYGIESFNIKNDLLSEKLDIIYKDKLKLIIIDKGFKQIEESKLGNSIKNDFTEFDIPFEEFFSDEGIKNLLINNKNINNSIFLFRGLDYHDITTNLAIFKINVSGGSNTKKHLLSPVQLRLARFIIAISTHSGLEVSGSFHYNRIKNQSRIDWTRKELRNSILNLNSSD